MGRIFRYYGQYQNLRGGMGALPGWGRGLILIAAVPGLILLALSLLALGVSIFALLVLTVPVYRLVNALGGGSSSARAPAASTTTVEGVEVMTPAESVFVEEQAGNPSEAGPAKPRRQIDVRIVEE